MKKIFSLEHQFNNLWKDKWVRNKFEGWSLNQFRDLPVKEQEYLLEFIRDTCAIDRPNKNSFKILNSEQITEAWRERKQFYRLENYHEQTINYEIGADYDNDHSSNPESLAIQKEISERYEQEKLKLVDKKMKNVPR